MSVTARDRRAAGYVVSAEVPDCAAMVPDLSSPVTASVDPAQPTRINIGLPMRWEWASIVAEILSPQ